MRLIVLPLFVVALIAAVPAPSRQSVNKASTAQNCSDRIQQVRDASGQPALDNTPATPGDGYLINAVDMRLDGCAVMQMKGNVNDLRPLPAPSGPAGLQPAH